MANDSAWAEVKRRLHEQASAWVMHLFPQAKRCSAHELGIGSLDGMAGESLKIVVEGAKAGIWRDFSGADSGNNLLDLLIKSRGLKPAEALKMAAEWCGYELPAMDVKEKKEGFGKLVAVYDYRNAEGALVHQTLRFDPKKFVQRRPGAKGMAQGSKVSKCDREGNWWLWTLEGIEPVLYHLPELRGRRHEAVVVTEGEKDADALAAEGLLATTCPMGSGKWRESYTVELAGRDVVICGDSDEAGRLHARAVGRALRDAGCRVRVVRWEDIVPAERAGEKWDAAKFLQNA